MDSTKRVIKKWEKVEILENPEEQPREICVCLYVKALGTESQEVVGILGTVQIFKTCLKGLD